MNRKLMMCVAFVTLISGCAQVPRAQQEMAYHVQGVVPAGQTTPIAAREFMAPGATLRALPTVTVVLKNEKNPLNDGACDAFKSIKTVQSVLASNKLTPNIILWRWPLDEALTQNDDCQEMIKNYSYSKVATWIGEIERSETSENKSTFSGDGPYLVEEIPDQNGVHYIVIDLSKSKGNDTDFTNVTNKLVAMLQAQSDIINRTTENEPTATKNTWTSKLENFWNDVVKYFCEGTQSTAGKLVLAALSFVPNASEAVTVINTIDKAVCPGGGSDANCIKNNSGQNSGNS